MLMPTQITDDARPRLARGVRLQIDRATGKSVLLFPEGIVELNETAQEILVRCDGRALGDIACALAEEYEADLGTLAVDVREILADLQRRKLVEIS
jgi:pyrroloquinoline quinone biosynthesis protein D